jgi:uncharacterized RDD family membrane protein YckC
VAPDAPPPSSPPLPRPGVLPAASLGRRLGALIYEALLLAALVLIAGFLLAPLVSPTAPGERQLHVPGLAGRAFEFCALVAVGGAYCVWSWSGGRRTLAMKTWRVRLVRADGTPPDARIALVRYAAAWLGPALALGAYVALRPAGLGAHALWLVAFGFLWAFVDPGRQFLHDRIAGTRLVVDA